MKHSATVLLGGIAGSVYGSVTQNNCCLNAALLIGAGSGLIALAVEELCVRLVHRAKRPPAPSKPTPDQSPR